MKSQNNITAQSSITSEERRYTDGYAEGVRVARKGHTHHPYCSFDLIWARGFKAAIKTYKAWVK